MKTFPQKKEIRVGHALNIEPVMANWVSAVSLLHRNYNQLTSYVTWYSLQQRPSVGPIMGIGQCPIAELVVLLDLFHTELEKLILTISTVAKEQQPDPFSAYKELLDHTLRLNQLNNQAQTRLHLASLPSS